MQQVLVKYRAPRPFLLSLDICICSYCHVRHPHHAEVLPFTLAHHCGHLVDDKCTKPQVMKGKRNYGAQVIILFLDLTLYSIDTHFNAF